MTRRKKVNEYDKAAMERTDVTFVTCLRYDALSDGSWERRDKVMVDKERSGECHGQLLL
jgi:hypothetical protein